MHFAREFLPNGSSQIVRLEMTATASVEKINLIFSNNESSLPRVNINHMCVFFLLFFNNNHKK